MKYCKLCGVHVDTKKDYCPLCYGTLFEETSKNTPEMFSDEKTKKPNKTKSLVARIFLTISIVVLSVCIFINISTHTIAWSALVGLGIFYLWILVAHTIISHDTPFRKIFWQVFAIVAFLVATDKIFGNYNWLTNYVFPAFSMLVMVVLAFLIFCSKKRKDYIFGIFSVDLILLAVSALFLIFGVDKFRLLNSLNIILQAIICFGYVLFAGHNIWTNLCRRFHL